MNVHGGTYAVEALQFQSVYWVHVHYSDENVSSLTCTTVPEILYYNRPGVTIDLRCVECNVWMWIHGELSLREVRTHISTGRLFARHIIDCMKYYTCIKFVMVHL